MHDIVIDERTVRCGEVERHRPAALVGRGRPIESHGPRPVGVAQPEQLLDQPRRECSHACMNDIHSDCFQEVESELDGWHRQKIRRAVFERRGAIRAAKLVGLDRCDVDRPAGKPWTA